MEQTKDKYTIRRIKFSSNCIVGVTNSEFGDSYLLYNFSCHFFREIECHVSEEKVSFELNINLSTLVSFL